MFFLNVILLISSKRVQVIYLNPTKQLKMAGRYNYIAVTESQHGEIEPWW